MKQRRPRQRQLPFSRNIIVEIPKNKQREVVVALAELLLAAARKADLENTGDDDEFQAKG